MPEKPYRTHQIRLDIKYFADHYEFSFMAPDKRKRNRKDYGKLIKWEWAIASGVGNLDCAAQSIPEALANYLRYSVRAVEHDLDPARKTGAAWMKKTAGR